MPGEGENENESERGRYPPVRAASELEIVARSTRLARHVDSDNGVDPMSVANGRSGSAICDRLGEPLKSGIFEGSHADRMYVGVL